MRIIGAVALLSVLLTGCNLGPKYKRPALPSPPDFYAERQITTSSEADLAWWDLFKDPILQDLIREALKNNYDLQVAVARVEEERALAQRPAREIRRPNRGHHSYLKGRHRYASYSRR